MPGLHRGLTLVPAASVMVTTMIGTGVFVKARVMTCNVGEPWLVIAAYVVAGLFTLAGALAVAELAAMMPRAGGMYNYLGAAYGRVWAFLFGWMETFIDGAGSMAAIAIVFVIFLNDLLGGILPDSAATGLTLATLAGVTILSLASIRSNGHVATLITGLKVALVLGIGVAAFVLGDASAASGTGAADMCADVPATARGGLAGFGAAMVGALWSYNGWAVATFVAEEVRDPGKTLPRSLGLGCLLVIGLYALVNGGYFAVLSPTEVASVGETGSVAAEVLVRLMGAGGASAMAAGLMLSSGGSLHASTLTAARIPFAMARDGLLPKPLARIRSTSRVPGPATILLGVVAVGYALSGGFDVITDLIVFVLLAFNGLSVAAVYVLRRRLPDQNRPYRVAGYPVVPALFLAATLFLMVNTLFATPLRALAGIGLLVAGLPVYFYYARKLPPDRVTDWLAPPEEDHSPH